MAIIAVIILVVAGVATYAITNNGSDNDSDIETVTIIQNDGTEVIVPTPVTRVCVVNTNAAEFLTLLGLSEKVVGVSNTMKASPTEAWWGEREDIGSYKEPSAETILETGSRVIIGQCTSMAISNVEALNDMGIIVILLDCYGYETQVSDLKQLASIFGDDDATAIANSYENFFNNIVDTLKSASSDLNEADKKTFISTMGTKLNSKYYTGSAELSIMLEDVCGLSNAMAIIMPSPTSSSAEINEEVIVAHYEERGIDLFILRNSSPYNLAGNDIDSFLTTHEMIKDTDMFSNIGVIKTIDSKVLSGPRSFVGMVYFITHMYPELDVDGLTVENVISNYNSEFGTGWTSEKLFYVYN